MTTYSRSAYGTNPNAGKSPNGAQSRGWGQGWPNCQTSKIVKVTNGDHSVNVRREISELILTLFKITAKLGYDINPPNQVNQTWGFACRAIANTHTPSNHSWGLAVDINSMTNPYSFTFKSDILPAAVHAWEVCGFYWGGRYTKKFDAMHFEYIGTPSDVAGHLAKAKLILASLMKPVEPPASNNTVDLDAIEYAAGGGFFHSGQKSAEDDARTVAVWLRDVRKCVSDRDVRVWEDRLKIAKGSDVRADWLAAGAQYAGLIKRFQVAQGLKADGIVGPTTRAKLLQALTASNYPAKN
jgi:hypothetical protein